MTTLLTPEQHLQLEQHGDKPVPMLDPVNQKAYVLVPSELFDRLRAFLDEGFDIRDTDAAQETALAQVWDDPALDVYNTWTDSQVQE